LVPSSATISVNQFENVAVFARDRRDYGDKYYSLVRPGVIAISGVGASQIGAMHQQCPIKNTLQCHTKIVVILNAPALQISMIPHPIQDHLIRTRMRSAIALVHPSWFLTINH